MSIRSGFADLPMRKAEDLLSEKATKEKLSALPIAKSY
jgi:hypothetical protein